MEETEQEEKTSPEFPETPEAEKPFSQQRDRDPEYSPEKETDLKDKNASLLETRQRKSHREKNPLKRRWRREYSDVSEEKEITALLSRQDKELVEQAQRQLAASLEQKQKKEQEKERKAAMEKKDPNSRSFFRDVARYYRGFEEKSAQRASQPKEEKENK